MGGCGDGTVPYKSLSFPKKWKEPDLIARLVEEGFQVPDIKVIELHQASHRGILQDRRTIQIILEAVTQTISTEKKQDDVERESQWNALGLL